MDSTSRDRKTGFFGAIRRKQFSIFAMLAIITVAAIVVLISTADQRQRRKKEFSEQFKTFVWQDNLDKVDEMLKFDPSLAHGREHYGFVWNKTALQMAAESPNVFYRILQETPNLEETSNRGETALTAVAFAEKVVGTDVAVRMLQDLIDRGADINGGEPMGSPVLTFTPVQAAAFGSYQLNDDQQIVLVNGRPTIVTPSRTPAAIGPLLPASLSRDRIGKPLPASLSGGRQVNLPPAFLSGAKKATLSHSSCLDLLLDAGADITLNHRTDGSTCLHLAVSKRDIDAVQSFVIAGIDVNARDSNGDTPLHVAMRVGGIDLARFLVSHGADPTAANNNNQIPGEGIQNCTLIYDEIIRGHQQGDLTAADGMLKAAPQVLAWEGVAPLLVQAATQKRMDVFEYLLKRGANPKVTYRGGNARRFSEPVDDVTLLHALASSPRDLLSSIRPITYRPIKSTVNVNAKGNTQATLPGLPTAHGSSHPAADDPTIESIVSVLVESGVSVNARDSTQSTPLHWAASRGMTNMLKLLIELGADVNAKNDSQSTPLHWAAERETLIALIESGADINAKNSGQSTPLHSAARRGSRERFEALIAYGADVHARDSTETSMMDVAFFSAGMSLLDADYMQTIAHLRQAGHDTNAMHAAATGNIEVLKELKEQDPELLFRTYTRLKLTPLFAAVKGRQAATVEWLLKQGANPNEKNGHPSRQDGDSLLSIAKPDFVHDNSEVALILIEGGIDVDVRRIDGMHRPDDDPTELMPTLRKKAKEGNERAKRILKWIDDIDFDSWRTGQVRFPSTRKALRNKQPTSSSQKD